MAGNDKPWIGTLYYYLISAITVVIMIFGGITGLQSLYEIIDPVGSLSSYEFERYSSFESFKDYHPRERPVLKPMPPDTTAAAEQEATAEELKERWQRFRTSVIEAQRHEARQEVVRMVIIYLICLPIFLIHWRYARRSGRSAAQ